jgi:cell division protein ZapA (FtsZ GTPase activity inhibitor)
MEKNKAIVKIRNKEYVIMSSDSQEYILSVAKELDARISTIAGSNSSLNPERLIILTALNLCDEYMKLSETNKVLQQQITNYEISKNKDSSSSDAESELETAKERIKLLEAQLTDDSEQRKQTEELKKQLDAANGENAKIKEEYEVRIKELNTTLEKKEKEFLEMIDKM